MYRYIETALRCADDARGATNAPVIEEHVGRPDEVGRQSDALHSAVLTGVPPQLVVVPFLHANTRYIVLAKKT